MLRWADREGITAYDETKDSGILRHIIGRQASNGDLMAGIVVHRAVNADPLLKELVGISGIKSVVMNINEKKTNTILGAKNKALFGETYITERFGGLSFRASLDSFLQVNHEQAEKLYDEALEFAGITSNDIVYDLFCGIGTLTLLAAKSAKKVIGIEYVESAVRDAETNASINGITNAVFIAGDAKAAFEECVKREGSPDVVLIDPPRKGCESKLIEKIAALSPKKVVYVSCNPATLARDAALFSGMGYITNVVRGVDMFPHTTHVETVALMSRV